MASASTDWFNAGSNPTVQTKCETEILRDGTTVIVYWAVKMRLVNAASNLGTGSLVVSCSCSGGGSGSGTIKNHNTRWSGTTEHTYSGSYTFTNTSTSAQTFTVYFSSSSDYFSSSGIFSTSLQCSVNGYNDYANITSYSVASKSINYVKIQYTTDTNTDYTQYQIGNGSWTDLPNTNIISGLSPNTNYNIKIRVRKTGTNLWTESDYLSVKTYDIGRMTSVPNFNHGDNELLTITNPSNYALNLKMKIGDTQILSVTPTKGSYSLSFTQTQLDNIYKLYGNNNSSTVTFVLTTDNNSNYTDTKTCTIILTGNQRTFYSNINDNWKRECVWINVEGTWKRAVVWTKVNNTWKRCI